MKCSRTVAGGTVVAVLLALSAMAGAKTVKHASHGAASHLVGPAVAQRSALRSVKGHVLSTKLENEDGKMQYAVTIQGPSSMHEVMIDAHTGKFASQEKVTAAEEAREAAAEAKPAKSGAKHPARK